MNRTLIAFALATAGLAGAASASDGVSYFSFGDRLAQDSVLELGTVRAAKDGVVEIRNLDGDLLGSTAVRAGANGDVRVFVGRAPVNDVVAELKVGGRIVATKVYDIIDD